MARALVRAGHAKHTGQALSPLTGPLYGDLSNKVTQCLIPVVGRLISTHVVWRTKTSVGTSADAAGTSARATEWE